MHTTFENLTSSYVGCRTFKAILSEIYSLDSEHCIMIEFFVCISIYLHLLYHAFVLMSVISNDDSIILTLI